MKNEKGKRVCIVYALIQFFPFILFSQSTHDSLYTHLLREYAEGIEGAVQKVSGGIFPTDSLLFSRDTLSKLQIKIGEPSVEYTSLSKRFYIRTLTIPIQQKDSIVRQKTLSYADTLDWKLLKEIRKSSANPLKGDNPSPWGRWIGPALLITTGIGGIFAVFFIRSN